MTLVKADDRTSLPRYRHRRAQQAGTPPGPTADSVSTPDGGVEVNGERVGGGEGLPAEEMTSVGCIFTVFTCGSTHTKVDA